MRRIPVFDLRWRRSAPLSRVWHRTGQWNTHDGAHRCGPTTRRSQLAHCTAKGQSPHYTEPLDHLLEIFGRELGLLGICNACCETNKGPRAKSAGYGNSFSCRSSSFGLGFVSTSRSLPNLPRSPTPATCSRPSQNFPPHNALYTLGLRRKISRAVMLAFEHPHYRPRRNLRVRLCEYGACLLTGAQVRPRSRRCPAARRQLEVAPFF